MLLVLGSRADMRIESEGFRVWSFSEQCLMLFSGMQFGAFMANRFQQLGCLRGEVFGIVHATDILSFVQAPN